MNTHAGQLAAVLVCSLALTLHAQDVAQPSQQSPNQGGVMLQIHVNAVLVPVVVWDAQGHAVGDLKQEDFKVFDQGKLRPLSGFSVQQGAPLHGSARPASTGSAAPGTVAVPATAATRFIVFLFDDRHLGVSDIEQVKKAGTQMLDAPLADSERALVLSFLGVNSGVTHDHAVLRQRS
jgi:VWFA-related protein